MSPERVRREMPSGPEMVPTTMPIMANTMEMMEMKTYHGAHELCARPIEPTAIPQERLEFDEVHRTHFEKG